MKMSYEVNQKVYVTVAETSVIGGGRHRGTIENIVQDMFDHTPLYLVRTKGGVIVSVGEAAIESYKSKNKKKI